MGLRRCVPYLLNLLPCANSFVGNDVCHAIAQADQLLVVTLIGASDIKSQLNFYVEIWSQPKEAAPKVSRSHYHALGRVDLSCEHIEIDWFGDEEEVVIQAVRLGGQGGKEKIFANVRVSAGDILKYAQECQGKQGDLQKGARLFELLEPQEESKQPDPIAKMLVQ